MHTMLIKHSTDNYRQVCTCTLHLFESYDLAQDQERHIQCKIVTAVISRPVELWCLTQDFFYLRLSKNADR